MMMTMLVLLLLFFLLLWSASLHRTVTDATTATIPRTPCAAHEHLERTLSFRCRFHLVRVPYHVASQQFPVASNDAAAPNSGLDHSKRGKARWVLRNKEKQRQRSSGFFGARLRNDDSSVNRSNQLKQLVPLCRAWWMWKKTGFVRDTTQKDTASCWPDRYAWRMSRGGDATSDRDVDAADHSLHASSATYVLPLWDGVFEEGRADDVDTIAPNADPSNVTTKAVSTAAAGLSNPLTNATGSIASHLNTTGRYPPFTTLVEELPRWKQNLPDRLQRKSNRTLQRIHFAGGGGGGVDDAYVPLPVDIYLIGTAHVSNDSSADVEMLLHAVRPHVIFVELCEARIPLMTTESKPAPLHDGYQNKEVSNMTMPHGADNTSQVMKGKKQKKMPKKPSIWDRVRETQQEQGGNRMQALSTVLLTSVQEDIATELNVELGGEFRRAFQYWRDCCRNATAGYNDRIVAPSESAFVGKPVTNRPMPHLVLGDRPLLLTLLRAWESLWWWPKFKLMLSLLWSFLQTPKADELRLWLQAILDDEETDLLTESFKDLQKHFPTLYSTILDERDAWLAAKLTQTSRVLSQAAAAWEGDIANGETLTIVAIVGAGHMSGVVRWLTSHNSTETPEQVLTRLVQTRRTKGEMEESINEWNQAKERWIYDIPMIQHEFALSEDNGMLAGV